MNNPTTLADYVAILGRRKLVVALCLLIVPIAAVLLTMQQKTTYQASAEVLLSRQNLAATLAGFPDVLPYQDPQRLVETQISLARGPEVAERAVEAAEVERGAGQLLAFSSVSPKGSSDVLVFTVQDDVPDVAMKLVNAYATEFTHYRQEIDTQSIRRTRLEVANRIRQLEGAGVSRSSELYASLVEKEEQLRTLEALQTSNTFVSQQATGAAAVEPPVRRNGVVGVLIGLTIGVAFAFALEALDRRVRSDAEMESLLDIPLLARIPTPPAAIRKHDRLAMLVEPQGASAEAFRTLRTSLEFTTLESPIKTLVVTSAAQQEGKSTTAANLAVALALGGRRTILVDLDLRRPYLDRLFKTPRSPGITDVVLRRASLGDALRTVVVSGDQRTGPTQSRGNGNREEHQLLEVLPAGTIPPNPGEFIRTRALGGVLAELGARADIVVIDSPPLLAVGDTLALTGLADGLLLVARAATVRRPMLAEVARLLATSPARKLGFVVTGSDDPEARLYGGYRYTTARAPAESQHVTP